MKVIVLVIQHRESFPAARRRLVEGSALQHEHVREHEHNVHRHDAERVMRGR
jgi:hypothetical protein